MFHFGRFNCCFEDFEKFFKVLDTKYCFDNHNFLYVQHIGDKQKKQHVHWVVETYLNVEDFKFLQQTMFRRIYNVKGKQQSYIKECKDTIKALVYSWRGCQKDKLNYKTSYDIEYLNKITKEYIETSMDTSNLKNSDYLNILVNDDEFLALVKNSSSYTSLLKQLIIKLYHYNRIYYKKYLSRKSLGDFAVHCLAQILDHKKIKENLNEEIIKDFQNKNNKVIVNGVLEYLVNTAHPDDIEYKIEKLDFKCY